MILGLWALLPLADFPGPRGGLSLPIPDPSGVGAGARQVVAGLAVSLGLAFAGLWVALRWGRVGKR